MADVLLFCLTLAVFLHFVGVSRNVPHASVICCMTRASCLVAHANGEGFNLKSFCN